MYLERAIKLANENVDAGGAPFGAVLVLDDVIIGEGVNETHIIHDISGHAELLAIRMAQKALGRIDLSGSIMYASGHPCPMCLGAIAFSGIESVVYANSLEEAASVGLGLSKDIYSYLSGNVDAIQLKMHHQEIGDASVNPMLRLKNRTL